MWREYGALDYKEWVGDDLKIKSISSFLAAIKTKAGDDVKRMRNGGSNMFVDLVTHLL